MKKSLLKKVVILSIAIIFIGQCENFAQVKKKKAKEVYTANVVEEWEPKEGSIFSLATKELPEVNKVEIFYLWPKEIKFSYDPLKMNEKEEATIESFGINANIISTKVLVETEAREFTSFWRRILRGVGTGCISPAYKLKFFNKDDLLLEADVCFHCSNVLLNKSNNIVSAKILGFNANGKSGQDLLMKLIILKPKNN